MDPIPTDESPEDDPVVKKVKTVQNVVDIIIDFPKPLVAVVNGPAVGIAATILGLMDAVYCTEKTWLHTPFTRLGLCPEGCSSYTFPRIMGPVKSNEMLLFSKKIYADEAFKVGLVTEVFPVSTLVLRRDIATCRSISHRASVMLSPEILSPSVNADPCPRLSVSTY